LAARLDVVSGRLFLALWVLVVVDLGVRWLPLRHFAEVVLALLMLLALLKASTHIRVLAAVLLSATAVATWRAGDWTVLERGLRAGLLMGAFLPVVMLVRATVYLSPTVPAIRERLGAMSAAERRSWMTGGAQMLGSILTLGYVSVQRPLLPASVPDDERASLAESGVRGLGMAILWSPFFVASAMASQLVPGVPAWRIVLLGLALSAVAGLIAHLMFNRELALGSIPRVVGRLAPIGVPTILLVGAVVLTSGLAGWNVLQSVIVVVPGVCAVYVLSHAPRRAGEVVRDVAAGAGRMGDEVLVLTTATMFGSAIAGVGMPDVLAGAIRALGDQPWLAIGLAVGLIAGLGLLGLHPMVTAAVMVPTYVSLGLPIADAVLLHIVVLAWSLSSMVSAWTLPVVVTSAAFGIPVRRLVFGANLRFVAVFGVAAVVALALLNHALQ